jgi:chaperonin GroEL (HSP60 family)
VKNVPHNEEAVGTRGEGNSIPEFPQANIAAVRAIADVLASTFGPLSNDKMIVNALASEGETDETAPAQLPTDDIVLANDSGTLLRELPIEHPIAPIILRLIGPERPGDTEIEGRDIYDGISETVILTASLLDTAEKLLEKGLHPYDVRTGYFVAYKNALNALSELAHPLDSFVVPRTAAVATARTAMTGNDVAGYADTWASLAVDAVDQVGMPDEETFVVRQISRGAIADSRLVYGAVLDVNHRVSDEMPKRVDDANVLVLDGHEAGGLMDPNIDWHEDTTINLSSPDQVNDMEQVYSDRRERLVDHYTSLGVDVIVTRLGINNEFQHLLADRGILGIRSVNRLDLQQLALATDASHVMNPDDVDASDLGYAGIVEEVMREPRRHRQQNRFMTIFDDCDGARSVVMMLHGVTDQIADQATTEVRKAAKAVATARGEAGQRPDVVPGAGATELELAAAVRETATTHDSRAQLAIEAFADALEEVVATLIANAGADRVETLADLIAAHARGGPNDGYILPHGEIEDAFEANVLDPVAYKCQTLSAATEVADLILKIDDTIDAVFTEEPAGPDDSIYPEQAEDHQEYLERNQGTRWD